jgi:beta-lactamase regulating signal transducer with metallopeptidase domain
MGSLFDVSLRSLAVAALAALCLGRVKSASLKHAVWSMVTAGMLLQMLLGPMLPPLPLPVLRPIELVAMPMTLSASTPQAPAPQRLERFPIMPAVYLAGVLFFAARLLLAFLFTRRLVRRSQRIDLRLFQCGEIAVPLTAGSAILLPLNWSDWDAGKLRAVLAHEQAHVRRRDSLVALLARINRCVFWFHPLAWWLERELAQLAEQACDDAALLALQDRQQYAQTLLDMARAVHSSNGRFLTAAMAKEANVETRINRILDESRRIPKGLGKGWWTLLAACAGPLIYFAAAVQLAPAQTFMSIPAPAAPEPPQLIAQASPAPASPIQAIPAPAPPTPAPAAQQEPALVSQVPPPRPRLSDFGGQLGGPIFIPKIYNGHNKSFFFFNYQDGQSTQSSYFYSAALKVSLDLSVQGSASIGIPFPEADGKYDIIALVQDQNGREVLNNRLTRVTGTRWNVQVALAPGAYVLKVLVRNNVDGRISTNQTDFEVK